MSSKPNVWLATSQGKLQLRVPVQQIGRCGAGVRRGLAPRGPLWQFCTVRLMGSGWLFVFVVALGLLAAAAIARCLFAAGWQRNSLSVAIVVLGMVVAFVLFFAAGSFVRSKRPQVAFGQEFEPHGQSTVAKVASGGVHAARVDR
jgi:hypothetical protein